MPAFVTVIILLLILGLVGFAAGVRKLRTDRGTIEHVSRELLIRLEAMEDRMERNERSLAGSRTKRALIRPGLAVACDRDRKSVV